MKPKFSYRERSLPTPDPLVASFRAARETGSERDIDLFCEQLRRCEFNVEDIEHVAGWFDELLQKLPRGRPKGRVKDPRTRRIRAIAAKVREWRKSTGGRKLRACMNEKISRLLTKKDLDVLNISIDDIRAELGLLRIGQAPKK